MVELLPIEARKTLHAVFVSQRDYRSIVLHVDLPKPRFQVRADRNKYAKEPDCSIESAWERLHAAVPTSPLFHEVDA